MPTAATPHADKGPASSPAVTEGRLLWTPSPERVATARLTRFTAWLAARAGASFADYEALWRWSVENPAAFWQSIWDRFDVLHDGSPEPVLTGEGMLDAAWFSAARTNYAEHLLRREAEAAPDEAALLHASELRPLASLTWGELGGRVRRLATRLRELGVGPGDRVASYMPNTPETAVAMLAAVAIGAVWSAAAPEFGAGTVVERFGQIAPKVLFAADGYSFGGRPCDRRGEVREIAERLPSVELIVHHAYLGLGGLAPGRAAVLDYDDLLAGPPVAREDFRFERVPSDHPLWVLYSSGTTGLPKAIVHGHAGMIVEHLKALALHSDLGPGKRMFFYTTTGWMVWNSVMAALITGASTVLYDGSPTHGGVDRLWRMAAESRATLFGASPTLVQHMKAAGLRPGEAFDLGALEAVTLAGAPATPETYAWFYDAVAPDLWLGSQSGGTDLCSALVAGAPTRPVHAGEIQCRALGIDVHVWDDDGRELIDDVGEMVVTAPFPSAPLGFWGDHDRARYLDAYFAVFPGVWRHGDLAKINARGGAYVYGRSDATLNRFGVRIGTAEIYRVLEGVEEVADSVVVCSVTPGGGFYMPMFVTLRSGGELTDELRARIVERLRREASPRHVPDELLAAPAIPYTLSGKKMEVPVRKILEGASPARVANRDGVARPETLDWFAEFAARPSTRARMAGSDKQGG